MSISAKHAAVIRYKKRHPKRTILLEKRMRCRKTGVEFTITENDIEWPEICPALGIPLIYERYVRNGKKGPKDNSPSFDRIDPNKGYIPGNVQILSNRANQIKSNATAEELMKVALFVGRV